MQAVGMFFGVVETRSENLQQWKDMAERKVKDGEFGLSLRRSCTGSSNSRKFVNDAEKVLSQLEAVQRMEDDDEMQDKECNIDEQNETIKHKDSLSNASKYQQTPGPSKQSVSNIVQRTGEKSTTLASHTYSPIKSKVSLVFNEMYSENDVEDDDDIFSVSHDSSEFIKTITTREKHVDFSQSSPYQVKKLKELSKAQSDTQTVGLERDRLESGNFSDPYVPCRNIKLGSLQQRPQSLDNTKLDPNKFNSEDRLVCRDEEIDERSNTGNKTEFISNQNTVKQSVFNLDTDMIPRSTSRLSCQEITVVINKNKENIDPPDMKVIEGVNKKPDISKGSEQETDDFANDGQDLSEDIKQKATEELQPEDFVYGREAYSHYTLFTSIERKTKKRELLCQLADKMSEYDWKIQAIDDLIALAKDYYFNPDSKKAANWKDLKKKVRQSSSRKLGRTEVRRKLGSLPEYRPFFTYFIIIAQLISFGVMCGLGGLTYIGLEPQLILETDVQTFLGIETVHKWMPPNVWIGPDQAYIVGVGGVFAPCMRKDIEIQLMYSRKNYIKREALGCCEIASRNTAGTTTESECIQLTGSIGYWRAGVTCVERSKGQMSVRHNLKPCCFGLRGQCELLSHKHCVFLKGVFHQFGHEHCSQVNCLSDVCKLGYLGPSMDQPWLPENPNQWWRLPLSLLYHQGIIHTVLVTVAQWLLLTQIEHTAGWLRMLIIYLVSGTGALMMSAIFSPYQSHIGGVGAIFGMVGVIFVELVQFWTLIDRPYIELAKILAAVAVFIFCGTLPYLNIFGILAGFVLGTLTGVILLPYITFQKWHTKVRVILIAVAFPLLIVALFLLFNIFSNVQSLDNCKVCKLMNCIPYTENMCKTELWQ